MNQYEEKFNRIQKEKDNSWDISDTPPWGVKMGPGSTVRGIDLYKLQKMLEMKIQQLESRIKTLEFNQNPN